MLYNIKEVASIDVDSQKGFTPLCPEQLPVEDGDNIVNALNEQSVYASKRIASKDAHCRKAIWIATEEQPQFSPVQGDDVDIRWNKHCEMGEKGAELLDGLPEIKQYDFFVWKGIEPNMHPYGICFHDFAKKMSTGIIEYLLVEEIKVCIVGGLATDYCVKETVLELLSQGFDVILNLEACRGIAEDTIETAIEEMEKCAEVACRVLTIIKETSELDNIVHR